MKISIFGKMSVSNFSNFALVEGLRAHNTGEKEASSGRTNSIKIGKNFLIIRKKYFPNHI
jgi:hypothetical protein